MDGRDVDGVQTSPLQASQQLDRLLTHAVPPLGTVQAAAPLFTLHFPVPLAVVRQQATDPERPQVEPAAHFRIVRSQDLGSVPALTACFTARTAHRTYVR